MNTFHAVVAICCIISTVTTKDMSTCLVDNRIKAKLSYISDATCHPQKMRYDIDKQAYEERQLICKPKSQSFYTTDGASQSLKLSKCICFRVF